MISADKDVSAAVRAEEVEVTLITSSGGYYTDGGKWLVGVTTNTPIMATIQPAGGRSLEDLPEGVRAEAKYLLWITLDQPEVVIDDRIAFKGDVFRVIHSFDRSHDGGYIKLALGQVRSGG